MNGLVGVADFDPDDAAYADAMEFLVEFEIKVPEGTPVPEVTDRFQAEAAAAAKLAAKGHIERIWKRPQATGESDVLGLYVAESKGELDALLEGLPLQGWMNVTVTPLEPHPNDPAALRLSSGAAPVTGPRLPQPHLALVYRLEAALGQPQDVGETTRGHRRIVPLTGGMFAGPDLSGELLPGGSADWQVLLPDGTSIADLRYTLRTRDGAVLYVQARGVRHGSPDVLARLGRGENVDASEYTFRTSAQIETAAPELDWLNKGVFVSVGGRQPGGVIYETYLVA